MYKNFVIDFHMLFLDLFQMRPINFVLPFPFKCNHVFLAVCVCFHRLPQSLRKIKIKLVEYRTQVGRDDNFHREELTWIMNLFKGCKLKN